MNGPNETGGAATPPAIAPSVNAGSINRYHAPADPHKVVFFAADGQPFKAKGKLAAFQQALIAAGNEGVAHVEVMPWLHNAADAARALRTRGVHIETRIGKPSRWVLRSRVCEVRP